MFDDRNRPPGLFARIFECAVIIAASGWLVRLGVRYLMEVMPVLVVLTAIIVGAVVGYRIWKHYHTKW